MDIPHIHNSVTSCIRLVENKYIYHKETCVAKEENTNMKRQHYELYSPGMQMQDRNYLCIYTFMVTYADIFVLVIRMCQNRFYLRSISKYVVGNMQEIPNTCTPTYLCMHSMAWCCQQQRHAFAKKGVFVYIIFHLQGQQKRK